VDDRWSRWRCFRDGQYGDYLEASISPGVYEIRRASDRETVKLACSENIAQALSVFVRQNKNWLFIFRSRPHYAPNELEYRFWSVATRSKAKVTLRLIHEQRASV
jgi:hypothetical protein